MGYYYGPRRRFRRTLMGGFVGPLDAIPNIVHAYCPARRLFSDYDDYLVALRRASDDDEEAFKALPSGEQNLAAIASWAGGANAYTIQAYDQKGGDHVTQATAARQPLFVASAQNGHAGVSFDGTDDKLTGTFTAGGVMSNPVMAYAVAQLDASAVNDGNNHNLFNSAVDSGTDVISLRQRKLATPNSWSIYAGAFVDGGDSDAALNLWSALHNGAGGQFWINATSEASGDTGSPVALTGISLAGKIGHWKGLILSVILANAAPSDVQREAMQDALNSYWSVY